MAISAAGSFVPHIASGKRTDKEDLQGSPVKRARIESALREITNTHDSLSVAPAAASPPRIPSALKPLSPPKERSPVLADSSIKKRDKEFVLHMEELPAPAMAAPIDPPSRTISDSDISRTQVSDKDREKSSSEPFMLPRAMQVGSLIASIPMGSYASALRMSSAFERSFPSQAARSRRGSHPDRMIPSRRELELSQSSDRFNLPPKSSIKRRSSLTPAPFPMASFDAQGKFVVPVSDISRNKAVSEIFFSSPQAGLLFPSKRPPAPLSVSKRTAKISEVFQMPRGSLELPGFHKDFYYQHLTWSKRDLIAVALKLPDQTTSPVRDTTKVYLVKYPEKRAAPGTPLNLGTEKVSVLTWNPLDAHKLLIGQEGRICIWDVQTSKLSKRSVPYTVRAMEWRNANEFTFSTNSITGNEHCVVHCDIRTNNLTAIPSDPSDDVISLKWNGNKSLLAMGLDKNKVKVWDPVKGGYIYTLDHKAAVKAMCWRKGAGSHHLFTAGGSKGPDICLSDTSKKTALSWQKTHAQICDMVSLTEKDIVTAHGFSAGNKQLLLWHFNEIEDRLEPTAFFYTLEEGRILNLAASPTEPTFCCAGDRGILNFYEPFAHVESLRPKSKEPFASVKYKGASLLTRGTR